MRFFQIRLAQSELITPIIVFMLMMIPIIGWADSGWYLITPPEVVQSDGSKIIKPAPLSEWLQYGTFSSIAECEHYKKSLPQMTKEKMALREKKEMEARAAGDLQQEEFNREIKNYWNHPMGWYVESSCISRDDARLRP